MAAENSNNFFEKWCYKIKIEDDIRDHWEVNFFTKNLIK